MSRLVNCQTPHCGAKVNYDTAWVRGYYASETGPDFIATTNVKEHNCPMCSKPLPDPSLNLPKPSHVRMGVM